MPSNKNAASVICPFYVYDGKQSITCEGIIRDTRTMTKFENPTKKEKYLKLCCARYQYHDVCPVAKVLLKKYEDTW
jgi:hypothetical protein